MPSKERISELDIGDGKLYEFAGANNGIVFDTIADAQAAITAGTVKDGDVFYVKYVSQGGTEIDAAGVGYDNTESELTADNVQDAVDEVVDELKSDLRFKSNRSVVLATGDGVKTVQQLVTEAVTALQGLTPLYDYCKIIYFRIPVGGASMQTLQLSSAINIISDFTNRVIAGYTVGTTSNTINIYAINSASSKYSKVSITANGTTFNDIALAVPNTDMSISVMIEDYQKG